MRACRARPDADVGGLLGARRRRTQDPRREMPHATREKYWILSIECSDWDADSGARRDVDMDETRRDATRARRPRPHRTVRG